MLKQIIPFLAIGLVFSATTGLTITPVTNLLEKALTTSDFFSFSVTAVGDPKTVTASQLNNLLTLGTKALANCEADGTNFKCKPAEAPTLTSMVYTLATAPNAAIDTVPLSIATDKESITVVTIAARPKTATVTGEIAADSDIEITLTANAAPGKAIAGSALSNYFKLGSVNLGTCSETGFAANAAADATTTIKCKSGSKLEVSTTPYTFSLQSGKTAVESLTIGAFGDVTVSAASNPNNANNGKFLRLSFVFFIFTLLF